MRSGLLKASVAAGWDPLAPNSECLRATSVTRVPAHLTPEDRRGVHALLIKGELNRRFFGDMIDLDEKSGTTDHLVTLHVLREAGLPLTDAAYHMERTRIGDWCKHRLAQADARLTNDRNDGLTPEEADLARDLYEPALSWRSLLFSLGWFDFEGDRHALKSALKLVEHRGVLPSQAVEVMEIECTSESVAWFLETTMDAKPRSHLFHVTEEGKFRLGDTEVRDALEQLVPGVEPVKERHGRSAEYGTVPTHRTIPEGFDVVDPGAGDPLREAEDADTLAAVSTWLASRAAREEAGSVGPRLLPHLLAILMDDSSVAGVAAAEGLDKQAAARAVRRIKEKLAAQLRSEAPA